MLIVSPSFVAVTYIFSLKEVLILGEIYLDTIIIYLHDANYPKLSLFPCWCPIPITRYVRYIKVC